MRTTLVMLLLSFSLVSVGQDASKLQRTYKAQIVTGTLEIASGATLIATGFYFKNKLYYGKTGTLNPVPYTEEGRYKTQAGICFATGALFAGIGIYSIVRGSKNRQKYFSTNGTAIVFTF